MADDFNTRIIEEFRANNGRVGGPLEDTPLLLLHHIGARSGTVRVTPLAYSPEGDDRYVIVASNGGSGAHPTWYYNLKASPRADIEVGTETFPVQAEELEGDLRAALWSKLLAASPSLTDYQATTARQIPMFMLTRAD
jgi:deazaflavin-dependent oxidoreductase (nitroreductase family)